MAHGPQLLTWVNGYKSLIQHFSLSFATATNQNEQFAQYLYAWWKTTQQTFLNKSCQNICNETAITAIFHFPHYKSMETCKLPLQQKYMSNSN